MIMTLDASRATHIGLYVQAYDYWHWSQAPGITERAAKNLAHIADLLLINCIFGDLEPHYNGLIRSRDGDDDDTRYCRGRAAEIIDQHMTDLETTRAA